MKLFPKKQNKKNKKLFPKRKKRKEKKHETEKMHKAKLFMETKVFGGFGNTKIATLILAAFIYYLIVI